MLTPVSSSRPFVRFFGVSPSFDAKRKEPFEEEEEEM
jgi:hypothetical protein